MFGSAVLLSHFTYRRFRDFQNNRQSMTNRFYLYAAFFVSLALYVYSLSIFISRYIPTFLPIGTILATIFNIVGFAYFLCIPINAWFSPRVYIFLSHTVSLFVVAIGLALIISPPVPVISSNGVVAWGFTFLQSYLILFLNVIAFTSNILILYKNFRESLDLMWLPRALAIILTFLLTGISGGYLYVGNNVVLLQYAYVLLFVGIVILFAGSLKQGSN